MSRTRQLLRREITYSSAKDEENRFFSHLNNHQDWIKNIVAHHLNLNSPDACHVSNVENWLHGSCNVCIPITVGTRSAKQVILRLPLPYRVGEEFMPGNGDEKVRCEAGTYAWLQGNCPDVPIPELYGFGLSTGETFTCSENLPLLYKWTHSIWRRVFAWLGIGSFIIDHEGVLILANRPLSIEIQQLENEHIPTDMHHDYTYSTVDSYVADVLTFHDNRFRYQPNAVNNLGDCVFQLSSLSAMRTISKSFFQREFRRGPFVFSLTDLHQSNIFVDADWNITCLVDLEWACSLPIEMIRPPHWFTNMGVDELVPSEYEKLRAEFMDALIAEEQEMAGKHNSPLLSDVMSKTWATGTFW
ncbi:hypothetical protein BO78DRAFT_423018 [Aspergillus sclerotiicarbonarius CBS 121057]|uniref:Aminoglycoside phosphotransferase domain-containing protein n=1 Tax=Aspergillus sclerotiicarbonarius (strain CBS 121057 / IBT 28362) TaxID=1448318 RepID=A0A319DVU4_ASPSB|nr:hypothetical protein BO78DRAFT_423018 [Aspergillus sclerotiicarbonarius CBS 121057]